MIPSFAKLHRPFGSARALFAATLGSVMLLVPLSARASQVIVTIKGVISNGTDYAGLFGPRGVNLSGMTFVATFTVDDSVGFNYSFGACGSIIEGANNLDMLGQSYQKLTPIVGTVQVGSGSYYFGRKATARLGSQSLGRTICSTYSPLPTPNISLQLVDDLEAPNYYYERIFPAIQITLQPSSPYGQQFPDANWESAMNDSQVVFDGDPDSFQYPVYDDFDYPPNQMYVVSYSGTPFGPDYKSVSTKIAFFPTSIVVSGPLPALPTPAFGTATSYPTGSSKGSGVSPQSAVADFNGDGILDIVTSNLNDSSISILFGNGNGTFQPPVNYTVPSGPYGIVAVDLNKDGRADIAVVSGPNGSGANCVSILLNNGSGRFPATPTYIYKVGAVPYTIAASDLNNDGFEDLVVSNAGDNSVSVLLGKGDGSFAAQVPYAVGYTPYTVAVGDLNHDGFVDIATANYGDTSVSVLMNDGTGKFLPAKKYPGAPYPIAIAIADVTRDNYPDILLTSLYSNYATVLANDSMGTGTFPNQGTTPQYAVGKNPFSFVVADMNGDGMPDLVVSNFGDNTISILLGQADGTFAPQVVSPTASEPFSLAVGDFNNDGRPDLSVNSYGPLTGVLLQVAPK